MTLSFRPLLGLVSVGACFVFAFSVGAEPAAKLTIAADPSLSRHKDLEDLFAEDKIVPGLKLANKRLQANPDDPELYVHAFRFRFARGEQLGRVKRKPGQPEWDREAWYAEMVELSERGLKLAPDHPRLLWGLGIAKGRLATTRGVLASLTSAKDIERAWLKVVESNYRYQSLNGVEKLPCDTMVALGMFYRLVPDWWIVGVIAGTRGDIDTSIRWLNEADRCRPDGIGTLKELGISYLCKAEREDDVKALSKGKAALKRALRPKAQWSIQQIDQSHARLLLNKPELACGYSRDRQQEYDENLLERTGETPTLQPPPG